MWSTEDRQRHARSALRYPRDLTDTEWALVERHIPPAKRGGRKRKVDVREVLQGVLYVLETGYDAGKKTKGVEQHLLVDTLGLMLRVVVHPANVQERDGAARVMDKRTRRRFPFIEVVFADQGYQGPNAATAVEKTGKWTLEIVRREPGTKGFAVRPKRWIVERTLSWIRRNHRIAKDLEHLVRSAKTFIKLAIIKIMLRRLVN